MSQRTTNARNDFAESDGNSSQGLSLSALFLTFLVMMTFVLNACATMKIPDYPKSSVSALRNAMTNNGLSIAVQPVTKKDDLEKYFGRDLYALKIVPLYIVAENTSSTSSFLLSKDKVSLQNKNTQGGLKEGARTDKSTSGEASLLAGALLVSFPLELIGSKLISDAEVVRHNMAAKEMQTHTVSPGKSVDGFIYFKLPDEVKTLENWYILIEAKELGSGTTHQFSFPAK
jgi:hypothetical protein